MSRADYQLKNFKNVSPFIKRALVNEARARDLPLSDVVGEILAAHWDELYELTGERNVRDPAGNQLLVRLPPLICARIWATARSTSMTESSVVQMIIADHYGILYQPVRRRGAQHPKKEAEAT